MKRSFLIGCFTLLLFTQGIGGAFCAEKTKGMEKTVGADKTGATEKTEESQQSEKNEIWTVPSPDLIRDDLQRWFGSFSLSPELQEQSLRFWNTAETTAPERLFDETVRSLRIASPKAARFFNECDFLEWNEIPFGQKLRLPDIPDDLQASDGSVPPRLAGALKMVLARKLIRIRYYDEALLLLTEMNPENTIDPVAVFYLRGIAYNQLLAKQEGLDAIKRFREILDKESEYSRRFVEVAKLLERELQQLDENKQNPSNISRRMQDIQRRLEQGRTDKNVQEPEKEVLDSLEQLIEKLEQQQQKQKSEQQGGQGNPAEESRILRQKGAGNVADKSLGNQSGWGELPPKEREAALQRIQREFPSHYRNIIEEYFRQMSKE